MIALTLILKCKSSGTITSLWKSSTYHSDDVRSVNEDGDLHVSIQLIAEVLFPRKTSNLVTLKHDTICALFQYTLNTESVNTVSHKCWMSPFISIPMTRSTD